MLKSRKRKAKPSEVQETYTPREIELMRKAEARRLSMLTTPLMMLTAVVIILYSLLLAHTCVNIKVVRTDDGTVLRTSNNIMRYQSGNIALSDGKITIVDGDISTIIDCTMSKEKLIFYCATESLLYLLIVILIVQAYCLGEKRTKPDWQEIAEQNRRLGIQPCTMKQWILRKMGRW